jgi:hypothetical protein
MKIPNNVKFFINADNVKIELENNRLVFVNERAGLYARLIFLLTGRSFLVITDASLLKYKLINKEI